MESGPVVAVLGGGIIGMSIAWRLAQSGAAVTVFDAGRIGNEASWAGAGMLAPGGEYDSPTLWAKLALESLALYSDFVEELSAESGIPIDFRTCGAFSVAGSEAEAEELTARIVKQTELGIYSEQFPPSRIPGLGQGAISAQYYPSDAVVNPRDVLRALRVSCIRAGVKLREFTGVNAIPGEPFERTVVAAGAWSSQIQVRQEGQAVPLPKSFPVRGHLIAFEEHTGLCDTIVRQGATYLLRRARDVVIAGSSTEHVGFDRTLDGGVSAQLAERAADLIPDLRGRRYMAWSGFRPGSETGEPVMGRLANSTVWLAYGHYRNGILLAPATARGIAREVLSGDFTPASSRTDSFSPDAHLR
jgi:glycine oxidase